MTSITLQYLSNTFATASAYNDKDLIANDLIRTATLFPLEFFTITSASINESDFNNDVALAINGLKVGTLHTSCSREIIGQQYGDFLVTSHTDKYGSSCNSSPTPPNREWIDLSSFVHIFPNPARNEVNIYFQIPDLDVVEISLYSVDGKLLKTLYREKTEGLEENEIKFYLNDISSGVYFVKTATSRGLYAFQKLVVIP